MHVHRRERSSWARVEAIDRHPGEELCKLSTGPRHARIAGNACEPAQLSTEQSVEDIEPRAMRVLAEISDLAGELVINVSEGVEAGRVKRVSPNHLWVALPAVLFMLASFQAACGVYVCCQ
jgi:hypothetical protein